jgi:site-specific DNA recombinase
VRQLVGVFWNVTTRKGHHEPLIDAETFERIQESLAARQVLPARKDLDSDFLLRGFVLCGECRGPYTGDVVQREGRHVRLLLRHARTCPLRHKCVRAERLHGALEGVLQKLRPRANIMQIVRVELLEMWNGRKLDVQTLRKQRQKKLDAIRKEIQEYSEAIKRCHNPTVIETMEEKIDELDARRVRLGGRIAKPKQQEYDFQTSLDLVFDFLNDPSLMWKTGDLSQRRLVLRLVFTEALAYDLKSGFQTPRFSLPINISCVSELDEIEVVDMLRKSSNTFFDQVREWAALLGERNAVR